MIRCCCLKGLVPGKKDCIMQNGPRNPIRRLPLSRSCNTLLVSHSTKSDRPVESLILVI